MGKFLALDTTGNYLTVIAADGDKVNVLFEEDCAMQHSVRLMPAVEQALQAAGMTPADCDFFCAVTGPGSFTGIRITSLQVLAYNARSRALAAIPAGRGNFYVYARGDDGQEALPPACVGEDTLRRLAAEYPVYGYAPLPVPYTKADPAAGLLAAVRAAGEADFGPLSALYLRRSQAEEERLARGGQA